MINNELTGIEKAQEAFRNLDHNNPNRVSPDLTLGEYRELKKKEFSERNK